MAEWISLERIKKQPFMQSDPFILINYNEIKDNVLAEMQGIKEPPEYPSLSAMFQKRKKKIKTSIIQELFVN